MSIITELKQLFEEKRPVVTTSDIECRYRNGNKRTIQFMYNDEENQYEQQPNYIEGRTFNVSTAANFAKLIDEELLRFKNESGEGATVKLTLNGGEFCASVESGEGCSTFKRQLSQQWLLLKSGINRTFGHEDFLQWFRGLKPSINNFEAYFRMFAKLRVIGLGKLKTNPYFTDGQQEQGYKVTYKLDGDDMEETLPNSFEVKCPFEKANQKEYTQTIELLFANNGGHIEISVFAPDFEVIEEQAIQDEAEFLKEKLSKHERLLILADFS